jgi:hypothetical protein
MGAFCVLAHSVNFSQLLTHYKISFEMGLSYLTMPADGKWQVSGSSIEKRALRSIGGALDRFF